jgi:hypothetical protein
LRGLDEVYRTATAGFPRRHRKTHKPNSNIGADFDAIIADPHDRQAVLQTMASLLAGERLSEGDAHNAAALILGAVEQLPPPPGYDESAKFPSGHSGDFARHLTGSAPSEEAVLDLSITAMRASVVALLPAYRVELDKLRDRVLEPYRGAAMTLEDEELLLGLILGQAHGLLSYARSRRRRSVN